MKKIVNFPLSDGNSILIETDEAEEGNTRIGNLNQKFEDARETFEQALDKIKPALQTALNKLKGLSDSPDEIGLEFGLKFGASSGVVIAAASMEANFKVVLKWQKQPTLVINSSSEDDDSDGKQIE